MTRDSGLFDSGAVTLFLVSSSEGSAVSGRWTLSEIATLPFQNRVVGYSHFYAAKSAQQAVDRAIRVDCYPEILLNTTDTVAQIDGRYFRVLKITPTSNNDFLPVLDLDLSDDDAAIRRKIVT